MNLTTQLINLQSKIEATFSKFSVDFQPEDIKFYAQVCAEIQWRISPDTHLDQIFLDYLQGIRLQVALNSSIRKKDKSGALAYLNAFGNLVEMPEKQFFRILETQFGSFFQEGVLEIHQDAFLIVGAIHDAYRETVSHNEGKPFKIGMSHLVVATDNDGLNIKVGAVLRHLKEILDKEDTWSSLEFREKFNVDDEKTRNILRWLGRQKLIVWDNSAKRHIMTDYGIKSLDADELGIHFELIPALFPVKETAKSPVLRALYSSLTEKVETIFNDHITLYRSTHCINFKIELDIQKPYMTFDNRTESATIYLRLEAPKPTNPITNQKLIEKVLADFEEHFESTQTAPVSVKFTQLLDFILASRLAPSRKKSYLWLQCFSDWGKGFLFGGVLKNLGIVCSLNAQDIVKAYSGQNVGVDATDLKFHWLIWVDEFRANSNEIKLLDQDFTASPKYALRFCVPTYAKVFTSANDVKSLSGGAAGVEEQIANRFSLLDVSRTDLSAEERKKLRLEDRPVFKEISPALYRDALETFVANYLKFQIECYLPLPLFDRHKLAEEIIRQWRASCPMSETFLNTDEFADELKNLIKLSFTRFTSTAFKDDKDLTNPFWSQSPALQMCLSTLEACNIKGHKAVFLSSTKVDEVVYAFIGQKHKSIQVALTDKSADLVKALHDEDLASFQKTGLPKPFIDGTQFRGIAFKL